MVWKKCLVIVKDIKNKMELLVNIFIVLISSIEKQNLKVITKIVTFNVN